MPLEDCSLLMRQIFACLHLKPAAQPDCVAYYVDYLGLCTKQKQLVASIKAQPQDKVRSLRKILEGLAPPPTRVAELPYSMRALY